MSGEGQQELDNLSSGGFSSDEIGAWQAQRRNDLSNAGFNDKEIGDYFGQPTPDKTAADLQDHFTQTVGTAADAAKGDETTAPKPFSFDDAVTAGWQMSVAGLMSRGRAPDVTMPEDTRWYQRLSYNAAMYGTDLPVMILGGAGAGLAGLPTGPGAVAAAGAGAFALPTGLRSIMMRAYKSGEMHTPGEFLGMAGGVLWDTAKGAVTGAATALSGLGGKVAATGLGAVKGGIVETLASSTAEVGTMITVPSLLEGHLPSAQDFIDGAIALAAFKTVPHVASSIEKASNTVGATEFGQKIGNAFQSTGDFVQQKSTEIADGLRNIYEKTGKKPDDVMAEAMVDPTVHQDVVGSPGTIPDAYKDQVDPAFALKAPAEPAVPPAPEPGSLEAAQKNILDKVEVGGKAAKQPVTFDDFYTNVVDSMNPLRNAVKDMAAGKELDTSSDPYKLARLTRGVFGKADQFLTNGTFDFNTYENNGKSLKEILTPFKGDLNGLRAFAVASRAKELNDRGIQSGFDPIAIDKVLNESGNKYQGAMDDLVTYQDNLTKYLRDSGVLSKDAYDAMTEANKSYVPFYRVMGDDGLAGVGYGGVRNPIKSIKGSNRDVIDPIENIIRNTYTYLSLADRNEVGQAFVDLARSNNRLAEGSKGLGHNGGPPIDPLAEEVTGNLKPTEVSDEEMTRFLQKQGITDVPDDLLTVFRKTQQPLADDQIAVYEDGVRKVYSMDPELAAVFKNSDKEAANWIMRGLAKPSSWLRAGVTLSPDFMPRNLIRDQFSAFVNSDNGFVPLVSTVQGLSAILGKTEDYQNWLKSGGANATMVAIDRNYIQNSVVKLNEETGFRDAAWNVVKSPMEALRVVSELAENSTRVGEFIAGTRGSPFARAPNNGVLYKEDIQDAGYNSREVTLDFARMGAKTSALNQLIAFWNANVQGIDRMARAFKENPTGTGAKILASVTIPSLLLWWANKDDSRYKNAADWQKDNFWIVPTDDWRQPKQGEATPTDPGLTRDNNGQTEYNFGTTYRIPKTQEAGILFGSGAERFLDYLYDQDPKNLTAFTKDIIQTYLPGTVPTFAQPMLEQWANKSFLSGNKIIPSTTEELLPDVQYQPYTTQAARAIGSIVGTLPNMSEIGKSNANVPGSLASPAIVENYVRQWSGNLGMYALQVADYSLRKAGVLPDPLMPATTLADTPFVKAFIVRYPSAGAQPIQDFYDSYTSAKRTLETVQYKASQGDIVGAVKQINQDPNALIKLDGIKEGLSNSQKLIQYVTKDPMLPPGKKLSDLTSAEKDSIRDQKRQIIESTYYQMISMAHMGNDTIRQINENMAK